MKQHLHNPWTNTLGHGNNIKKSFNLKPSILEEVSGITSFQEFLDYYNNGDKRGKTLLLKRLKRYKQQLSKEFGQNIDPIRYLIFLYFQEGKSVISIFENENDKGLNYKENRGLGKLFKDTFGWILRDTTGSDLTTKRRKSNGQINKAQNIRNEIYSQRHEKVTTYIKEKINTIFGPFPHFEKLKFDTLKKQDKILYILSCLNGITKNDIVKMKKNGSGDRIIASELNKIIQNFIQTHKLNDFIILPRNIRSIRKNMK